MKNSILKSKMLIILLIFILVILIVYKFYNNLEYFNNSNKNIICFLTVNPCIEFYNFCKKLKASNFYSNYQFYISIDDNSYNIPNYSSNDNIHIIKINEKECIESGFQNTVLNHRTTSRDKALYYFCSKNINFKYLWLIEEDVLIPNLDAIYNFDNKYYFGDLCCPENKIKNDRIIDWHWKLVFSQTSLSLPLAKSMICAIRISKKLLNKIYIYAKTNKTLFLDEALFNTLALKNNLQIINPIELNGIKWRHEWNKEDIKRDYFYHPIKCMKKQYNLRLY